MTNLGKILVIVGLAIAVLGAVLWFSGSRGWLGRLPGDILVTRGQSTFYFPWVSCLVVSVVLSALLWLLRR